MKYFIINRDCFELLPTIKDNYIDLVITSPPYYRVKDYGKVKGELDEGNLPLYVSRLKELFCQLYRVLKPDGVLCLNIDHGRRIHDTKKYSITAWKLFTLASQFSLIDTIIWHDKTRRPSTSPYYLSHKYEPVFILSKTNSYTFNKDSIDHQYRSDIWEINYLSGIETKEIYDQSGVATFPMELALNLIKLCSNKGDMILDPFAGSGTVMEGAIRLRRDCMNIEINFEYCKNIEKRARHYLRESDTLVKLVT